MTNLSDQYVYYIKFLYQISSDLTVPKNSCDWEEQFDPFFSKVMHMHAILYKIKYP